MLAKGGIIHCFSLILGLLLGACSAPPSPRVGDNSAPDSPLQIDLVLDQLPRLGKEVQLTATVFAFMDLIDVSAEIQLPEGAKHVDGELTWQGDLMEKESVQIQVKIVFTEEGNWILSAVTQKRFDENHSVGETDDIHLHVSKWGAKFGFDHGCPFPLVAVSPLINLEDGSQGEVKCRFPAYLPEGPAAPEPTPLSRSKSTSNG